MLRISNTVSCVHAVQLTHHLYNYLEIFFKALRVAHFNCLHYIGAHSKIFTLINLWVLAFQGKELLICDFLSS
jgi:hypothetical protein